MTTSPEAAPVGGRVMTRGFRALMALAAIAALLLGVRFTMGIGSTTALSDGYPWGIWIAFDVVTGTAIACGGYAIALLVYIMNRGRYHRLVRSALVTSALGYTLAGLSVVVDLGRWWNVYSVPLKFWHWNLNSVLLEVALCIMLYMLVLWIELSPAFLERARTQDRWPRVRAGAAWALPKVNRAMPFIIALGLLLPTMHQSSLGSLMLLAGPRLHPLWLTPLLPMLFLVSCFAMGFAGVIVESSLSGWLLRRPGETRLLRGLAAPAAFSLLLYAVIRIADIAWQGKAGLLLTSGGYSVLFFAEMLLLTAPAFVLYARRHVIGAGALFRVAIVVLFGGALYRFSTFLIAFQPGAGWRYFPALPELLITFGLVAAEIMAYIAIIRFFPILGGAPRARPVPVTTQSAPAPRALAPHGAD